MNLRKIIVWKRNTTTEVDREMTITIKNTTEENIAIKGIIISNANMSRNRTHTITMREPTEEIPI
jgi:hypothetical protein